MKIDIKNWFSLHRSLSDYDGASARRDVVAGLSVGVVLVPQAMAYAVLGGLPPVVGLYASLIPLLAYAMFGGARHVGFGIVAIDMLILSTGLQRVVPADDPNYVSYAFMLAGMVGLIQLAMVSMRLAFVVNFLARPVVIGFTTAAPILIALSQVENLSGMDLPSAAAAHETLGQVVTNLEQIHPLTLGIGLSAVVALYAMRALNDRLPGALIVVSITTLAAWGFGLEVYGVETLGKFEAGLPTPEFSIPPFEVVRALLPTAITMALVQYMALMSIAKSFGARAGYAVDADRELRALGIANLVGSIFKSPPVSGSFSRSSLNYDADSATPLNNVVAAGVVFLSILLVSPVFEFIPLTALAAIILVSALGMVVPRDIRALFRIKRADGLVALVTIVMTLVFGIQEGVLLGIGSAMALILYRIARPTVLELGRDAPTERWQPRGSGENEGSDRYEGIMVLRIDGSLTFVNAEYVKDQVVEQAMIDRSVHAVILDLRGVNDIDATAEATLEDLLDVLAIRDVKLYFSNVKSGPYGTMKSAELLERLPEPGVFQSSESAVEYVRESTEKQTELLRENIRSLKDVDLRGDEGGSEEE